MEKEARKHSEDPKQEHLRESKDKFNALVKQFITLMIEYKRSINGRGSNLLGIPASKIINPLPPEISTILGELSSLYQSIAQQAASIIQEQEAYSQNRRQPGAQPMQPRAASKIATASAKKGKVRIGDNVFETDLAITAEEKERGLMFVKEPKIMSFINQYPSVQKFWMRNTPMALDLCFAYKGSIVNICQGEPNSTKLIGDDQLSDLVIELPQGYCKSYGIKIGDPVNFIY